MPLQFGELRLYDVKELAEKFKLTQLTVRSYIKQGKLKGQKMGTRWYVSEGSLEELFSKPLTKGKRRKVTRRG